MSLNLGYDKTQTEVNIMDFLSGKVARHETNRCQRKQHTVYAILPPAGFALTNEQYHTETRKYLRRRFNKNVVHISQLEQRDRSYIGMNCYLTDGETVVICVPPLEIYTMTVQQFISTYKKPDNTDITKIPTQWTEFIFPGDDKPIGQGVQLPSKYIGLLQQDGNIIYANSPKDNVIHYTGDIVILNNDNTIRVVNNGEFRNTYNLTIGGWANQNVSEGKPEGRPSISLKSISEVYQFTINPVKEQPINVQGTEATAGYMLNVVLHENADKQYIIPLNEKMYEFLNTLKHSTSSNLKEAQTIKKVYSNIRVIKNHREGLGDVIWFMSAPKRCQYWKDEAGLYIALANNIKLITRDELRKKGINNFDNYWNDMCFIQLSWLKGTVAEAYNNFMQLLKCAAGKRKGKKIDLIDIAS